MQMFHYKPPTHRHDDGNTESVCVCVCVIFIHAKILSGEAEERVEVEKRAREEYGNRGMPV